VKSNGWRAIGIVEHGLQAGLERVPGGAEEILLPVRYQGCGTQQ